MNLRSVSPRTAAGNHGIERVPWELVEPDFIEAWGYPGGKFDPEHLTVYGKSGGGKTYFVAYILAKRAEARGSHVVIVATKAADKTLIRTGWPVISRWPPDYGKDQVILWAKAKGLSPDERVKQRAQLLAFMNSIWSPDANIIIYWDELPYIEGMLKLRGEIETFYREGRSHGVTNVASAQRPSGITRFAHSEAGWTAAFPPKDADDRKRVAEVLGDRARFMAALDDLDRSKHEFLLRHDRSGETVITHLPARRSTRRPNVSGPNGHGVRSGQRSTPH